MRNAQLFAAKELINYRAEVEKGDGVWVPARPEPYSGFYFLRNLILAWRVFTGKYDAVTWYKQ